MIFLDQNTIYRILQRELPEDVYPDGAPSGFFSTSDNKATAIVLESLYTAASGSYQEFFPATSTKRIDDWTKAVFGQFFDATVTTAAKQKSVTAKMQKIGSLANWALLTLVLGYVPQGTFVQIYHPCGDGRFWLLGVSQLGVNTFLANKTAAQIGIPAGTDMCFGCWCSFVSNLHWRLGQDQLGVNTFLANINYTDLNNFQNDAYLYTVKIFNFTLDPTTRQNLDRDLSNNEPARSSHRIVDGLNLATSGLNTVVPNINQFSDIDCAAVDPTSSTGYTGRTT